MTDLVLDRTGLLAWLEHYQQRLKSDPQTATERCVAMLLSNPKYILRNHLAEIAIRKAEDENDFSEIERLHDCLKNHSLNKSNTKLTPNSLQTGLVHFQ